jgi:hypothetical protein
VKIRVLNYKGSMVFQYSSDQVPEVGDTFTFPVWAGQPKTPVEGCAVPAKVVGREWIIHVDDSGPEHAEVVGVKLTLRVSGSFVGDM